MEHPYVLQKTYFMNQTSLVSASHHNVRRVPVVLPSSQSFTFKIMAIALDDILISGFWMILSSKLLSVLWDDTAEQLLPEDFGSNIDGHLNCQGESLYEMYLYPTGSIASWTKAETKYYQCHQGQRHLLCFPTSLNMYVLQSIGTLSTTLEPSV